MHPLPPNRQVLVANRHWPSRNPPCHATCPPRSSTPTRSWPCSTPAPTPCTSRRESRRECDCAQTESSMRCGGVAHGGRHCRGGATPAMRTTRAARRWGLPYGELNGLLATGVGCTDVNLNVGCLEWTLRGCSQRVARCPRLRAVRL